MKNNESQNSLIGIMSSGAFELLDPNTFIMKGISPTIDGRRIAGGAMAVSIALSGGLPIDVATAGVNRSTIDGPTDVVARATEGVEIGWQVVRGEVSAIGGEEKGFIFTPQVTAESVEAMKRGLVAQGVKGGTIWMEVGRIGLVAEDRLGPDGERSLFYLQAPTSITIGKDKFTLQPGSTVGGAFYKDNKGNSYVLPMVGETDVGAELVAGAIVQEPDGTLGRAALSIDGVVAYRSGVKLKRLNYGENLRLNAVGGKLVLDIVNPEGRSVVRYDAGENVWEEVVAESLPDNESKFYKPLSVTRFEGTYKDIVVGFVVGTMEDMATRGSEQIKGFILDESQPDRLAEFTKVYLEGCWAKYKETVNKGVSFESYLKLVKSGKGKYKMAAVNEKNAKDVTERMILEVDPRQAIFIVTNNRLAVGLTQLSSAYWGVNENGVLVTVRDNMSLKKMAEYKNVLDRSIGATNAILDGFVVFAGGENICLLDSFYGLGANCGVSHQFGESYPKELTDSKVEFAKNGYERDANGNPIDSKPKPPLFLIVP